MSRNGLSLGLSVCAVTIPSIVVIGYLLLQPAPQTQPQLRQDKVIAIETPKVDVVIKADVSEVKPDHSQFVMLDYPEFGNLKALPQPELTEKQQSLVSDMSSYTHESLPQVNEIDPQYEQPFSLEELDLSELSPRVAQQVQSALIHSQYNESSEEALQKQILLEKNEPRYQGRLPALNLQTHMYSNDTQRRWVKINGVELREGEALNNLVELILIEPRSVTIRFDSELIKIPALYEWDG
jgi:general secretion pathway protein B